MKSLENFLRFLNENFVSIMVCIGLIVGFVMKVKNYLSKSDEERIAIVKQQIQQTMLKMITDAEMDYEEWNESGAIKRSQVIREIYERYPILSTAINQEDMITWIDEEINNSLKTLRKIVKSNKEAT